MERASSYVAELLDLCVDHEIIKKSGAWFSYKGEKIGQGKEAAKNHIKSDPATHGRAVRIAERKR